MPIMDGLAATRMIRSLEAEHKAEEEERRKLNPNNDDDDDANKHQSTTGEGSASSGVFKPTRNPNRIPIVGLSADIQHATKEVNNLIRRRQGSCVVNLPMRTC